MEIFEELTQVYNELRSKGIVRTKKELAEILGVSDKGIIKAMKGDPQYATPSLRTKFLRFRDEKLGPAEPPQPDAKAAAIDRLLTNMMDAHAIAMKTLEQNDRLIALLEMEEKARAGVAPVVHTRGKTPGKLTIKPAALHSGAGENGKIWSYYYEYCHKQIAGEHHARPLSASMNHLFTT